MLNYKMVCSNFANALSKITAPKLPNNNEFVPFTSVDTNAWKLQADGSLKCCNAGEWAVIAQYQFVGQNDISSGANGTIEGWFIINDKNVADSAATAYVSKKGGSAVLTIALNVEFKKGDNLKLGIRSTSVDGKLNSACVASVGQSGVGIPSVILALDKV